MHSNLPRGRSSGSRKLSTMAFIANAVAEHTGPVSTINAGCARKQPSAMLLAPHATAIALRSSASCEHPNVSCMCTSGTPQPDVHANSDAGGGGGVAGGGGGVAGDAVVSGASVVDDVVPPVVLLLLVVSEVEVEVEVTDVVVGGSLHASSLRNAKFFRSSASGLVSARVLVLLYSEHFDCCALWANMRHCSGGSIRMHA